MNLIILGSLPRTVSASNRVSGIQQNTLAYKHTQEGRVGKLTDRQHAVRIPHTRSLAHNMKGGLPLTAE